MKKFGNILILILIVISFFAGFLLKTYIDCKQADNLERLNTELKEENKRLVELNDRLLNFDNPIDKKEKECLQYSKTTEDTLNCNNTAQNEWHNEISKYLDLLKITVTTEQYKIVEDSQNLWLKQIQKDSDVINEFIYNNKGTMYKEIAADDYTEIVKNRAMFLKWIYVIYADKTTENSD